MVTGPTTSTKVTYCRLCSAICGLLVDVEDGRVQAVRGDPDNPLSRGFTCSKGRRLGELHHRPDRFLTAQRRTADGLAPIDTPTAVREIGARLWQIVADHGPDAVGLFVGTQTYTASLTMSFATAFLRALGSHKLFMTMTIDQSAKVVTTMRLGSWNGGRQRFDDSDVWMLVGTNPLVSMQGGDLTGVPVADPVRRLREAKARGLRLVVVDPRRTETAAYADHHLRPRPGTDAWLLAAMANVILTERWHDSEFCAEHVDGLGAFTSAVRSMTPAAAQAMTGVAAADLVAATRTFALGTRGMAKSGTGPDMGPWSNLNEHLVQALNVLLGRFPRAGDRSAYPAVLNAATTPRAQVDPPRRLWEEAFRSRLGPAALGADLPTAILPDEILQPGPDRLRALIVSGGNPAVTIPDPAKVVTALRALDLLVTVDPYPSETARLADYVIAPTLALERADSTRGFEEIHELPFAQYTEPVLEPPSGVVEDWQFFFSLAQEMGLPLEIGARVYAPDDPHPRSEDLLAWYARRARVPLDEVRRHPHGLLATELPPIVVQPAVPGHRGRFDLLPPDVADELRRVRAGERITVRSDRPFLLTVRRSREALNTVGRAATNPCALHPDDAARLGVAAGAFVRLRSDHGTVVAVAALDDTLLPGTVTLTHGYGGISNDDPRHGGTNPGRLLSLDRDTESINVMPRMTAVPVAIEPV